MQNRIDLLTRSLPEFQTRDSGAITVPVLPEGTSTFGDTLTKVLNEVSDARDKSEDMNRRFAAGENVEMSQVMAATEEGSLALDLVVELRNKAIEAYRTVINMQS